MYSNMKFDNLVNSILGEGKIDDHRIDKSEEKNNADYYYKINFDLDNYRKNLKAGDIIRMRSPSGILHGPYEIQSINKPNRHGVTVIMVKPTKDSSYKRSINTLKHHLHNAFPPVDYVGTIPAYKDVAQHAF